MTDAPLTTAWFDGRRVEVRAERVKIADLDDWKCRNDLILVGWVCSWPLYWPRESLERGHNHE